MAYRIPAGGIVIVEGLAVGERAERRLVMDGGSRPSVEGITRAVRAKGGTLACPVCGREGFALVEMTVLGAGMAEQYGTRRQQRAQLVCESCGHVMNFGLTKVRVAGGQS